MKFESRTLSENPFKFDIQWPFPNRQRKTLEKAVSRISVSTPAEVSRIEYLLSNELGGEGYVWDHNDKEKCSLWRPDFNMSVDFFNESQKIAIEVEKTEVKRIIHDILKLMNASLTFVPRIRYGVIIHPETYKRTTGKMSPFGGRVRSEVPFYIKSLLPNTRLNDLLL